MIKHVVSWKFKPEISGEERAKIASGLQVALDKVKEVADGVIEVRVIYPALPSGNVDLILDSSFESVETLAAYQVHPDHVAAGAAFVKPYMTDRTCCDYEA